MGAATGPTVSASVTRARRTMAGWRGPARHPTNGQFATMGQGDRTASTGGHYAATVTQWRYTQAVAVTSVSSVALTRVTA